MNSSCVLNEKNKIQKSIQYLQLPDKEANWELTMEHINQVSQSQRCVLLIQRSDWSK